MSNDEDPGKVRRRRWAGIAFVVAALVAAAGTAAVGLGGDWLAAARGAALTGVFVIAALIRLRWEGRSSPLLDTLTLALAVAFVVLLVAAG
ncbi:MAG: hypothetical protein ACLGH4_08490 [Actinomycetes bacterium]